MEQATGEVDTIFGVGNGWVNDSAPLSDPHTLRIPGGAAVTITQQETTFLADGHALMERTAQNLHRALMGGTPMLHNTGVGGNVMGGTTGPVAVPLIRTAAFLQQL